VVLDLVGRLISLAGAVVIVENVTVGEGVEESIGVHLPPPPRLRRVRRRLRLRRHRNLQSLCAV
jgi:hypothetical protein